ncbi:FKBP-type peptidyl-prolyl cis-trans isomerase [Flexivirga sp.]|uniref:FKBP-type peptidyl-prolyl cis-trans isomerase n=1 Tax=Flexivirga sp. TaxID=1962927 RepID=UPI003F7E86E0
MRRIPLRLLAAGTLPALLLACCGSSSSNGSGSSSKAGTSSSQAATSSASTSLPPYTVAAKDVSPMSAVKVTTAKGKSPAITLGTKPFQVNKTTVDVKSEGTGAAVKGTDLADVSYVAVDGRTGKTLADTFANAAGPMYLQDPTQFPGLVTAIKGKKVGTVETIAVPPKEAFGSEGNSQLGVTRKDSIVFYLKINGARPNMATGTPVPPKSGMPKVTWNGVDKPATITMPDTAAPKKLESANLINGTGPTVKKGQTISALYTGVIWTKGKAGKVFDSTGNPGRYGVPASFPIGEGKVIPGWDKVLVGKKVGDRVLMVIPPADGYGKAGNPQGGIKGTDTLVFVVDIVGAN